MNIYGELLYIDIEIRIKDSCHARPTFNSRNFDPVDSNISQLYQV